MANGKLSCWIYVRSHIEEEIAHRMLENNGESTDVDVVTGYLIREFAQNTPQTIQDDPFGTFFGIIENSLPPGTSISDKALSAAFNILSSHP